MARGLGSNKTQKGMTLLEVLLSVVILAIGMLGIAGMLMLSSRANNSSYNKQQAVQSAYDILDRIRANYQAAAAGSYNINNISSNGTPGSVSNPSAYCDSSTCNASQMASWDTWYWLSKDVAKLPNGSGSITTAPSGNNNTLVTVTIQWDDSAAQSQLGAIGSASQSNANMMSLTIQSQL